MRRAHFPIAPNMAKTAAIPLTKSRVLAATRSRSGEFLITTNYSGNRYPKIKAGIVVEPIDETARVSVNRARAVRKSCEGARSKACQNGKR